MCCCWRTNRSIAGPLQVASQGRCNSYYERQCLYLRDAVEAFSSATVLRAELRWVCHNVL